MSHARNSGALQKPVTQYEIENSTTLADSPQNAANRCVLSRCQVAASGGRTTSPGGAAIDLVRAPRVAENFEEGTGCVCA